MLGLLGLLDSINSMEAALELIELKPQLSFSQTFPIYNSSQEEEML